MAFEGLHAFCRGIVNKIDATMRGSKRNYRSNPSLAFKLYITFFIELIRKLLHEFVTSLDT